MRDIVFGSDYRVVQPDLNDWSRMADERTLSEYYERLDNHMYIDSELKRLVLDIWRRRKVPEWVIQSHIDAWNKREGRV